MYACSSCFSWCQLCLAILMHDASHKSLFKNKKINDFVGDWLCARPIWNDLQKYRVHHVRHHAKTSTPDDPDLSLVAGFPVSKNLLLVNSYAT
ncbi:fatty acid desaturase [Acinetobacter baumannii]